MSTRPPLSPVELTAIMRDCNAGLGPTADGAKRMETEILRCWLILAAVDAGLTAHRKENTATQSLVDFWAEGEQ